MVEERIKDRMARMSPERVPDNIVYYRDGVSEGEQGILRVYMAFSLTTFVSWPIRQSCFDRTQGHQESLVRHPRH